MTATTIATGARPRAHAGAGGRATRVFISVGEASGDLHAANLIREMRAIAPQVRFEGFGGDRMETAGCKLHADTLHLASMGISFLGNIFSFLRLIWRFHSILRRDPPGSLIETERAIEFGAYRAFHGTRVPVPEPLWLEEDPRWLDHPFFVMRELVGFESSPQAIALPPYAEHAERFAERKWSILGEIARADPKALGLDRVMEPVAPEACWQRELARWERVLDEDEYHHGVELIFEDHGPGIENLEQAMVPGYTSGKGLGMGLPGSKRLMDEMEVDTAPGRGTVAEGEKVYAAKCASCHGKRGEGGTADRLVATDSGKNFDFALNGKLVRAVGNYWPYATTLYDYTYRAMPFMQPGTLTPDETYSLVAYILALNKIVPEDAVMDAKTLPAVKMPARNRFVVDNRKGGKVVK